MSEVIISTTVTTEGGVIKVAAHGSWADTANGEGSVCRSAQSIRELDTIAASTQVGVTKQELVEATKRDALRELVTMLNVHGVL